MNPSIRAFLQATDDREGGDPEQFTFGPSLQFYLRPLLKLKNITLLDLNDAAGARFKFPFSPKASVIVAGDAGGGQAAPDYQVWGLLGYQFKKNLALQAGYSYLSINHRSNDRLFLYDMITSGAVIGAKFYLK